MNFNAVYWARFPYYLRHPINFFRDCARNYRAAKRRIKYGWCYMDAYNMDNWILSVFPDMLRRIADDDGYPGYPPFDTYEKWGEWLRQQATKLETCREDVIINQYEEDFFKAADERRQVNGITVSYSMSDEEFQTLKNNYFKEVEEINKIRANLVKEVFNELGEHFFKLWS